MACSEESWLIGGSTPKASAVSITMFFGGPPWPLLLTSGMKSRG